MSDLPDAADEAETQAVDRLERALDRIAAMVRDIDLPGSSGEALSGAELRARLDQLVGKLRATLAASRDPGGN